ncbi:MAG: putative DNA binding domain-containing protein [Sphaerochaetaceae bacterium]|nr:putative DNA binding domain-containing protein [Sphaerochaetaceae bacterium]
MTEEQISKMLSLGESSTVEFKRCGNGFEADTYETVCSFSNRFGGTILCGVQDDGTVIGLPDSNTTSMVRNFITVLSNPNLFQPTLALDPEVIFYKGKTIIAIHVPVSAEVHSYKHVVYDRVGDCDIRSVSTSNLADMYIRKRNVFTEQKIYEYVGLEDLRPDLISLCRKRAVNKRSDHPWKNLDDLELLKSARLYAKDYETGKQGLNLAAVLLLGRDEVIGSICPAYKTDAILRKYNVDRYDDRETISTNLIDSYDRLIAFSHKHLWDKFCLENDQTISLRDIIVREMVSNILIHREYSSTFVARFVIENTHMYTENACRATRQEQLTPENLVPVSKNPIIASFFSTIGNADELGSGTRNLFKYSKLYSGKCPTMMEDDIFKLDVPLDDSYSYAIGRQGGSFVGEKAPAYLTSNQRKIVAAMASDGSVTAARLSEIVGISTRKVEENIRTLRESGIIRREGSNKSGRWVVL